MRVLILSITAGQGHHSAAKSLSVALKEHGAETKTVDVYRYINRILYDSVNKGYLLTTKYTPMAYRRIYTMMENKDGPASKYSVQSLLNVPLGTAFKSAIESYSPDAIVCTHIFAAQLVNELKRRGKLTDIPAYGIITDYTVHPFWEDVSYIEHIIVASELLTPKAIKKGIAKERIFSFGIPVDQKFKKKLPRENAARALGLSPDLRTVLVMAGSMGYGDMPTIISEIHSYDPSIQILAVCGNNRRQYKKLLKQPQNAHIYGYINNVDIMMDVSDCIITKPGGLTITEALVKHLPILLTRPIPGQEERNIEFMINNGAALAVTKTFPVDEALFYLFEPAGRVERLSEQLKAIAKPDAADDLVRLILNLS